jgi:hypothetical protein
MLACLVVFFFFSYPHPAPCAHVCVKLHSMAKHGFHHVSFGLSLTASESRGCSGRFVFCFSLGRVRDFCSVEGCSFAFFFAFFCHVVCMQPNAYVQLYTYRSMPTSCSLVVGACIRIRTQEVFNLQHCGLHRNFF